MYFITLKVSFLGVFSPHFTSFFFVLIAPLSKKKSTYKPCEQMEVRSPCGLRVYLYLATAAVVSPVWSSVPVTSDGQTGSRAGNSLLLFETLNHLRAPF